MNEKYVMINLNDEKTESIANSITNKTARSILNYLSEKKEGSESDIAKELKIAASTVNYNIEQLVKAGLIKEKRFMWSVKGKKIKYYELAKKFIVISPDFSNFSRIVKEIIPAFVISGMLSLILWVYLKSNFAFENGAVKTAQETLLYAPAGAELTRTAVSDSSGMIALGFFAGCIVALLIFVLIRLVFRKK